MKQLYQNDPRWKNQKIGLQDSLTIEQVGCMLSCLAMTVNYFGGRETPASLNDRMKAANGFNGAWIKSAQVPGQFPQLGFQRQKYADGKKAPIRLADIDAALKAGSLVMVRVDWTPDANIDSHWVILHQKQGDDYLMWDPWQKDGAPDTLLGRYSFGGKKAENVILEAIWHGKGDLTPAKSGKGKRAAKAKPAPKAKPEPAAKSKTAVTQPIAVKPTVPQLTMRRQPQIKQGNVIKTLTPDDVLTTLEDATAVRQKIGQNGQWLQVQDQTGEQGYVAAWYVQETAVPTPKQSKSTAKPVTAVKVKTTTRLALRSAPRVTDDTLIKYLPQGTKLTLQNPADAAKIGQQNQWLAVKIKDGNKGYVAAWYVKNAS